MPTEARLHAPGVPRREEGRCRAAQLTCCGSTGKQSSCRAGWAGAVCTEYTGVSFDVRPQTGECPRKEACTYAHNVFEYW